MDGAAQVALLTACDARQQCGGGAAEAVGVGVACALFAAGHGALDGVERLRAVGELDLRELPLELRGEQLVRRCVALCFEVVAERYRRRGRRRQLGEGVDDATAGERQQHNHDGERNPQPPERALARLRDLAKLPCRTVRWLPWRTVRWLPWRTVRWLPWRTVHRLRRCTVQRLRRRGGRAAGEARPRGWVGQTGPGPPAHPPPRVHRATRGCAHTGAGRD